MAVSKLDEVVSPAKRRGFFFPAGEIYGGTRSAWDYGPLGVALKDNIKREWWRSMVVTRGDVVGVDTSIILPTPVWVASGHVAVFNDPLVECLNCHKRQRSDKLEESYAESRVLRNLMSLLGPFKITPATALKIYQHFGPACVDILKKCPYDLCQISGFGFKRVDGIVRKTDNRLHSTERIKGAVLYTLEDARSKSGHLFLPAEDLTKETLLLLNAPIPIPEQRVRTEEVQETLQQMILHGAVVAYKQYLYSPRVFGQEDDTAGMIAERLAYISVAENIESSLESVRESLGITLSQKQEQAVRTAFQHGLTIITGSPGTGKTTIARLIPRFFDVQAGAVLLGGRDVRSIPTAELMEQISFVFQEVRLFKKSIRDNIRAARPDATEAEILHAAQLAQCSDILEKTPGGLDAVIGSKGVYLSGGEMQRIALARAILKDAPIVVLDEASSFADPENEAKIQKAFEALMKGKTVLMIAHRLSTVRNMDRILVIRDGEIAEEGKHDELLEKGGVYAAMWEEYQKAAQWKVGGAA